MNFFIYHNPSCSNSRKALEILREAGHEPVIVEIMNYDFTMNELVYLKEILGTPVIEFMRTKEPAFAEAGLSIDSSEEELLQGILDHPILLQRPIVVKNNGEKGLICRPGDLVRELL